MIIEQDAKTREEAVSEGSAELAYHSFSATVFAPSRQLHGAVPARRGRIAAMHGPRSYAWDLPKYCLNRRFVTFFQ